MKKNYIFGKKRTGVAVLFVLFCGMFVNTIMAQTSYTWVGGGVGDWNTATNWSPNGVPGGNAGDSFTINNGTCTITASPGTVLRGTLGAVAAGGGQGRLIIDSGQTLTVNNTVTGTASGITFTGGTITNNGILSISNTSPNTGVCLSIAASTDQALATHGVYGSGVITINSVNNGINIAGINANTPQISFGTGSTIAAAMTKSILNATTGGKVLLTGAGFSAPSVDVSLFIIATAGEVIVDAGTTINAVGNGTTTNHHAVFLSGANTAYFTNNGTVNLTGDFFSGIKSSGTAGASGSFVNTGTFNVNLVGNTISGLQFNTNGPYTINNSGTLNVAVTVANPMTLATVTDFTNTGTINLSTTAAVTSTIAAGNASNKFVLSNNGTITSNVGFTFSGALGNTFTNNASGVIKFTGNGTGAWSKISTGNVTVTNNGSIINTPKDELVQVLDSNDANVVIGSGAVPVKLRMNVNGNTTPGINFDQLTASTVDAGFDVTNATLDVTGIYTPTLNTTVDILLANGTGVITGPFSSVVGLSAGWSVDYGITGKVMLKYDSTLGIKNHNAFEFAVYPNPVQEVLNIQTQETLLSVQIIDASGRVVLTQNKPSESINVSSLNKGIYVLRLASEKGISSSKIVKK
ncbi:T9SS type A sorting domain-containing protein [Flavobacterium sp.]|uniref:T9SS type A sorting domain-containing protein n=1 Tax=Flavobacterium sp. TaxID=239 RepID=UPI003C5164A7